MKCIKCGHEVLANKKFCTYCGEPTSSSFDTENSRRNAENGEDRTVWRCPDCGKAVKQGKAFCTYCGAAYQEKRTIPQKTKVPRKSKGRKIALVFVILSFVVAALLIAAVVFRFAWDKGLMEDIPVISVLFEKFSGGHQDEQKENIGLEEDSFKLDFGSEELPEIDTGSIDALIEEEVVEDEQDSQEVLTSGAATAQSNSGTSHTEPSVQDISYKIDEAVYDYLTAYVTDICDGVYNKLYYVVESGSELEEIQKDYIENSDLYEDLIGCDIIDKKKISASVYHVTTVEEYDVYNYVSDANYYVKQKCIYEVKKQGDGGWKVANYVDTVEQLEKIVYE